MNNKSSMFSLHLCLQASNHSSSKYFQESWEWQVSLQIKESDSLWCWVWIESCQEYCNGFLHWEAIGLQVLQSPFKLSHSVTLWNISNLRLPVSVNELTCYMSPISLYLKRKFSILFLKTKVKIVIAKKVS